MSDVSEPSRNRSFGDTRTMTLTDWKVLGCCICHGFLTPPVYECKNGHMACSSCCINVRSECPSCCSPIIRRNRAIEKIVESAKVTCQYKNYGCEITMRFSQRDEHEKLCPFTPCQCPLPDCNFIDRDVMLCWHFYTEHSNSATRFWFDNFVTVTLKANDKYLFLQEGQGLQLFVLKNSINSIGNSVSLHHLSCAGKREFFYNDISVRSGGSSYRFQSRTKIIQRPDENPASLGSFLIPSSCTDANGQLKLNICIWGRSSSTP